jgi:hypothetical protein
MAEIDEAYTRRRFVDFIDAIVISAVFSNIAPLEFSFRFFGMLFLLLVILEDFYLAHTQLATLHAPIIAHRFPPLVIELAISLSWYLAAIAFPAKKGPFLVAFSCFSMFKWLAGFIHWRSLRMLSAWQFKRNCLCLLCAVVCFWVLFLTGDTKLRHPKVWGPVAFAWVTQTICWWRITKSNEVKEQPPVQAR